MRSKRAANKKAAVQLGSGFSRNMAVLSSHLP